MTDRERALALMNLLVLPWPAGGYTAGWLPVREGGYPGGVPYSDGSSAWWFECREDAEAAVMWRAEREWSKKGEVENG